MPTEESKAQSFLIQYCHNQSNDLADAGNSKIARESFRFQQKRGKCRAYLLRTNRFVRFPLSSSHFPELRIRFVFHPDTKKALASSSRKDWKSNTRNTQLLYFALIMIFFSFFKTLVGKEVAIELKNDVVIMGVLLSVDQYLNVKLKNVHVVNSEAHPQLATMKNCFIRGSAVR